MLLFGAGEGPIDLMREARAKGKIVGEYSDIINARQVRFNSYKVVFEGYDSLCCNTAQLQGDFWKSLNLDERQGCDIFITYVYDGGKYKVRLESFNVDVSKLAEKYGGGGHRGAAGFSFVLGDENKFPWTLK